MYKIKLYRSYDFFNKENVLSDNEVFFLSKIKVSEFYEEFLEVMKEIDNAELLDKKTGMIKTPFGVCSKDYLSTGCKTVLNLIYLYRHKEEYQWVEAIDATECGINAISIIIDFLEKTEYDMNIILRHGDGLCNCKKSHYIIDNKIEVEEIGLEWLID